MTQKWLQHLPAAPRSRAGARAAGEHEEEPGAPGLDQDAMLRGLSLWKSEYARPPCSGWDRRGDRDEAE